MVEWNFFIDDGGYILQQYKVSQQDVGSRTVWVSVWDWDRFGRNQFLGEVRLPLASLDLTDATDHWHSLQDQVSCHAG